MVRRLVGGCDFRDQGSKIEIEAAVEGTFGGGAVYRGQHDSGDEQDHHHPAGRGQKEPGSKRAGAHQIVILKSTSPGERPMSSDAVSGQDHDRTREQDCCRINSLDQLPAGGGVSKEPRPRTVWMMSTSS